MIKVYSLHKHKHEPKVSKKSLSISIDIYCQLYEINATISLLAPKLYISISTLERLGV